VVTIRDATGTALSTITKRISYSLSRTGATGADSTVPGSPGASVKTATTYIYYQTAQAASTGINNPVFDTTAPSYPYNFITGALTFQTANGWAQTPPTYQAGTSSNNYWYKLITISQTDNGEQTITQGSTLLGTSFTNLVTFTSLSSTGTTTIDGGRIDTNTLSVDRLTETSKVLSTGRTFRLGGSSLVDIFNGVIQTRAGLDQYGTIVDQAAIAAACQSTNYPAIGGVGFTTVVSSQTVSSWGGGFYNFSGSTKNSQGVIGHNTYAGDFLFNISGGIRKIQLANSSYAAQAALNQGKIIAADGFTPFTGVHDGLIARSIAPSIGDILIDHEVLLKLDVSNIIAEYVVSSIPNQKGVIGICNTLYDKEPTDWQADTEPKNFHNQDTPPKPDYYPIPSTHQVVHVNALGEGMVNVCGEGGAIEKGDLIVTSSIPGKGMKQGDDIVRSITVAKARESVTFSNSTEIKQIACIYMCG
jgi:hypothetical protein